MGDTLEQGPNKALLVAALAAIGAFESSTFKSWEVPQGTIGSSGSTYFKMKSDIVPGAAFPRGPWTSDKLSPEEFLKKQTAELNNGRLAMIAIFIIVLQGGDQASCGGADSSGGGYADRRHH